MKKVEVFVIFILIFLSACFREPTPVGDVFAGRVYLSQNVDLEGLRVVNISSVVPVQGDGTFITSLPLQGIETMMVIREGSSKPLLLGIIFPEHLYRPSLHRFFSSYGNVVVDAESTALALVLMNPFFVGVSEKSRAEMAEVIVSLPEFQNLVRVIERTCEEDPYRVLDGSAHPEIFIMATDLLPRALEAKFGTSDIRYRRSGVSVDNSRPWVECTGGSSIKFLNPTMVYYWADIVYYNTQQGGANCANPSTHFILPKTRFYDLTCVFEDISCVLDLFQVPPEDTSMNNFPSGTNLVAMYKGFGDYTVGVVECGGKGNAMLANIWQSIKYVLALATSWGNLLPEGHLVVTGLNAIFDETKRAEFKEALNTMDMWTIIGYVINIISLFKDQILSYLQNQFGSDAASTFLNAATSILGDIFRFATMAYELTSRTGPYFYDLVSMAEYSAYFVNTSQGCLVDGNPIIMKVFPQNVSPGSKVVISGFFFGTQNSSKAYIGQCGNANSEAIAIYSWSDVSAVVKAPLSANGNEVCIINNGKQSNIIRVRFSTPSAVQDSGGCVYSGKKSESFPLYAFVFFIPALIIPGLKRAFKK